MIQASIFPGRYIQGAGALSRLGKEAARFGKKVFAVCDPFVIESIIPTYQADIKKEIEIVFEKFNGECSDKEINRIIDLVKKAGSQVVVAVGGGKTIDTAKAVAHALSLPVIVTPTIASTDAPCSALSVIYTDEGVVDRYLFLPTNPNCVLVDTTIIANAPVRFLVSGMGDALSTWLEAKSCQTKYANNFAGEKGSMTAYALAKLCYDTLLEFGVAAKISNEANVVTPALESVIEANTLLSGLGFESGGIASCHAVHNGLTVLEPTHKYFHGEKVSIGVVTSVFLTNKPADMIDEVYDFCESVGLPTTLAQVGLINPTDEDLMKVATRACAEGETIYNELVPITPESVFAAIKAADAYGRSRLEGLC
ncbi:MAG: glycerol dehydrogenase [Candidatus Moranbacteria bacterium]|nr:glycerol dehydrogenase [Candidatus Moranbacteria bacterium]